MGLLDRVNQANQQRSPTAGPVAAPVAVPAESEVKVAEEERERVR
jgi:hypothetical protein